MSAAFFEIEIPEKDLLLADRLAPAVLIESIVTGMNLATPYVLSRIQEERLNGEGPFPVEEHRLGRGKSRPGHPGGQLSEAAYSTPAIVIDGETVISSIGSPVFYAGLHEFGSVYERTTKPGKVRLREDRKGELLLSGNLATFAKKSHKLAREVSYEGGKTYTVTVPARAPFGHGLADHADTFVSEIARAIAQSMQGGTP